MQFIIKIIILYKMIKKKMFKIRKKWLTIKKSVKLKELPNNFE